MGDSSDRSCIVNECIRSIIVPDVTSTGCDRDIDSDMSALDEVPQLYIVSSYYMGRKQYVGVGLCVGNQCVWCAGKKTIIKLLIQKPLGNYMFFNYSSNH